MGKNGGLVQYGLEWSIIVSLIAFASAIFIAFYNRKDKPWWVALIHCIVLNISIVAINIGLAVLCNIILKMHGAYSYTFYMNTAIVSSVYLIFFNKDYYKAKIIKIMAIYSMYFILVSLSDGIPLLLREVKKW